MKMQMLRQDLTIIVLVPACITNLYTICLSRGKLDGEFNSKKQLLESGTSQAKVERRNTSNPAKLLEYRLGSFMEPL